ncbi:MAG: Gfo/Idh/MocA family protein [Saccharofermentanales bacterium]
MARIKAAIVGMGFIGGSHIEAIRRIGFAELVAVADVNYELAQKKAQEFYIPQCYATIDELLSDPQIQVVHNCTPNNLHLEVNEKIIKAGKHVFSEKPLARNSAESRQLLDLLADNKHIVHGVNFNYRMNPLVQEMKQKVKDGEIGVPKLVHGSYLQDWLLLETDYNWRIEPEMCGLSRCIADIGSHWMDTAQAVVGSKITSVCSDLVITIPVRKKPKGQIETFSVNTNMEYEDKTVKTEDYGAVLIKFDNGAHGVFYASEVSAGRKCFLNLEVDGTTSSLYWNQETADQMWMGFRDKDNNLVMRNPNFMSPEAKKYTYLAAGHPEGWNDALKNNIQSYYSFIRDNKVQGIDACDFATFDDAHYIIKLTEAILKSNETRSWVDVQ